jgi:phage gpG-like protein
MRNGRPLQKTGTLRKSFAPPISSPGKPGREKGTVVRFEGVKVTIGTNLLYAGMMNDGTTKMPGGKLVPVRAKALKIPLQGGKFMFRRSVKIPARPMNEITQADMDEFSESVANHIAEILGRPYE